MVSERRRHRSSSEGLRTGIGAANPPMTPNPRMTVTTLHISMPSFPPPGPIAAFCDCLVAHDLPDLPAERRAAVVAFAGRRIAGLPTPMRVGVGVVSLAVDGASRVVGRARLTSFLAGHPLPVRRRLRPARAFARPRPCLGLVAGHLARPGRRRDGALEAEVLVVGSGAGGAPTAAILAEAGFDVLVLEEGPLVRQGEVTPFSLEQMDRQYRAGGVTVALGRPSIAYTEGCCAGGGTEINSGLYRRPPEEVVDRWRTRYGVADLDPGRPVLDLRRGRAGALRADRSRRPHAGERGAAARRGGARLAPRRDPAVDGLHERARRPPRPPAQHDRDVPPSGRRRRRPPAHRPPCPPTRARRRPGDPGRDHRRPTAGRRTVDFAHVVVCGGAIQTPALLQRSGLRHRVGRTLAVHPTVKLAARFDDAGQRSRRRPGPSGQGVRAGPVLRRLGVRTRPRRPRPQRLVAPVPRRRERLAEPRRVLRGDHERGSRPRPGPPAACATRSSRIA